MRVSKLRLAVGGFALATVFGVAGAGAAVAVQTHMFDARDDLQAARTALQQAVPDKAGHREAAIDLIGRALDQVDQGIQAGAR
ncbi:hypothetical protein FOS14_16240 [Skermania sp. ID1734]|uniref:hypothetical protein n=1 Tax=Skermania sp. ID1734 TaxID=2597516 RepID=UPI00117FBCAF|nr:hypothetical protein [Skermania sp. ID1734]TSD96600.1 hypothetical protein FOS14_16240 [Skermania sp. ID1734]